MKILSLITYFQAPLESISHIYTDRVRPLFEKAQKNLLERPFSRSIVGRVTICATSELIGAFLGSFVATTTMRITGTPDSGFARWLAQQIMATAGGYLGLMFAKSEVPFWDRSALHASYGPGMIKSSLAEVVFPAMFPFNLVIKAMAYNSNMTIHVAQRVFQERNNLPRASDAFMPLIVNIFCNKYCEPEVRNRIIYVATKTIGAKSWIKETFASFIRLPVCFDVLSSTIEWALLSRGDQITANLMRSFHSYIQLVKEIDDPKQTMEEFERKLMHRIGSQYIPDFQYANGWLEKNSTLILNTIQRIEKDLTGYVLTKKNEHLKNGIKIHLKYFFIYTLINYSKTPLTCEEERTFFIDITEPFLYKEPTSSNQIIRLCLKIAQCSFFTFFTMKEKFTSSIRQPEQQVMIFSESALTELYAIPTSA